MTRSDESAVSFQADRLGRRRLGAMSALSVPGDDKGAAIEISFPAHASSLEIVRSVIGRASRIAGFSYDGIEDFAMAVDEAATLLIESHPSDLILSLRGMEASDRLEVEISAQDPTKVLSLPELRDGYRWDVLQALCEEVWWVETGTAIGLSQSTR